MKFLFKLIFYIAFLGAIIVVIGYVHYTKDLPDIEDFGKENNQKIIQVNFSNGEPIASFGDIYRNQVQFFELPKHLINAVIATEDRDFFSHHGIDVTAIIRASYINHKAGRIVQGASTITQQLVKLLFLKPEKTFKRKIQEAILAFKLEKRYTKEQILTSYLNHAYFGSGNYGVASAARYYFKKDISQINLNEAALLAGLLKAPSKLSPKNDKELAEERTSLVLSNMIKSGLLNENNLKEIDSEISYQTNRLQRLYFADFVYDQFRDFLGQKDLKNNLIVINSTLNQKIQEKLEDEMDKFVDRNAKSLRKSQIAVIIMDKNGAILGMTGGNDYQKSQYNRAVLAKRQAGSIFKTFVYLTAFEEGFTPEDIFEDKKINISNWNPDNYNGNYYGKISLEKAFANSLNSVSVQLAQQLDRKKIAMTAKKLGITSPIDTKDLTIALGTSEVTLLELTSAYSSIANEGKPVIAHYISEIKNDKEAILYKRESSGFSPVLSAKTIDYGKQILRAVIEEGTGKKANVAGDIYGKTGTSQNFHDAWFIGFDSDFVVGIWIGNDDSSATDKITGGSLPAEFFAKIISRI